MMERYFSVELQELSDAILRLGSMVEEMIAAATTALTGRDARAAQKVLDQDQGIDEEELAIHKRAHALIARYQPAATDLRFVTTAIMISTELERIGDLAGDIAQRVLEIYDKPLVKPLVDIPKLSLLAQSMVHDTLDAFVAKDPVKALAVCKRDNEADRLRDLVQQELVKIMTREPAKVPQSIPLLLVARHLERICDHATNIAEEIVYWTTGDILRHRPRT